MRRLYQALRTVSGDNLVGGFCVGLMLAYGLWLALRWIKEVL